MPSLESIYDPQMCHWCLSHLIPDQSSDLSDGLWFRLSKPTWLGKLLNNQSLWFGSEEKKIGPQQRFYGSGSQLCSVRIFTVHIWLQHCWISWDSFHGIWLSMKRKRQAMLGATYLKFSGNNSLIVQEGYSISLRGLRFTFTKYKWRWWFFQFRRVHSEYSPCSICVLNGVTDLLAKEVGPLMLSASLSW